MLLRVILVDDEAERAALLAPALTANGFLVVGVFATGADLAIKVTELAADIIIVDMDSPDRDTLEDTRRKISGTTRSDEGRDGKDAFLGLGKTCRKLRISFWEFLGSRLGAIVSNVIPPLSDLVAASCCA